MAQPPADVEPFRIDIPDADLHDLRRRLLATRWPDAETVDDWSQGVPVDYLRELCAHWASDYDWRPTEARINALPQVRVAVDGLRIHAVHARSPHPDALPLVLTNGWPGSVVEYLDVVGPLTDPAAHGGDARDAFHVICPTLPGYGFSDKPTSPGWGVERIAAAWSELTARLGYDRYGAVGSDWGTSITARLGQIDAERIAGIHLIPPLAPPDPDTFDDLAAAEQAALAALRDADEWGSGYSTQQSTRPQTVGYGLVDSPAALCAWIVEKFRFWTDPRSQIPRDRLLDNVMLYWLTGTGASSARLYWESIRQVDECISGSISADDLVTVPTGCSVFPYELHRPSRRWAQKRFPAIVYWNEPPRGGHFAALEQPELFVDEVRAFFRLVRG